MANNDLQITHLSSNCLPIMFYSIFGFKVPSDYLLDFNHLILFLDAENYSIQKKGNSDNTYQNSLFGATGVIEVSKKTQILTMNFQYCDYYLFKGLEEFFSLFLNEKTYIYDFHFERQRCVICREITPNSGVIRTFEPLTKAEQELVVAEGVEALAESSITTNHLVGFDAGTNPVYVENIEVKDDIYYREKRSILNGFTLVLEDIRTTYV